MIKCPLLQMSNLFAINRLAIIVISLFLGASNVNADLDDMVGKEYYLNVNVWYDNAVKIYTTNYHRGAVLHIGSKFKITDVGGKSIRFENEKGVAFRIIHQRKHSPGTLDEIFDRYFGKINILDSKAFKKFTKKEQKHIRSATLAIGMSKDAVLMAYGYPPEHRTPNLEADRWLYWGNRWASKGYMFEKDKLVSF